MDKTKKREYKKKLFFCTFNDEDKENIYTKCYKIYCQCRIISIDMYSPNILFVRTFKPMTNIELLVAFSGIHIQVIH